MYAIHYAASTFREGNAIDGGGADRIPFGWYAFLVTGGGRRVLVDTGFESEDWARRFGIARRRRVDRILAEAGVAPESLTDVVATHGHWDHVGGIGRYPAATVWLAAAELEAMAARVTPERPAVEGYRWEDLEALRALGERLRTVGGEQRVGEHVRLVVVGGHTPGSLAVVVEDGGVPVVVLASDNAYLYRNLEEGRPIPGAARVGGGEDALPRLRGLADQRAPIVPGHDPLVTERHERAAPDVARLYGPRGGPERPPYPCP